MEALFKIAEASAQGILYLMGLMSIVSIAITIERHYSLKRIGNSSRELIHGFKKVLANQSINQEQLQKFSEDSSSLEGRALGYGLSYVKEHGANGLDDLFSFFKTTERPGLEKNLNILGTIASNAPYVGLLGTVMGIMKAFNDLANSPGQGNEVVMAGIAHALVATACGLAVAIPAVVAFNHFQKKVSLVLGSIDAARDLCLAYTKSNKA